MSHTHPSFSLTAALGALPPEVQPSALAKKQELEEYLTQKYRMPLRDDSRLAYHYVADPTFSWTLEELAAELWYMKLLYQYTDYAEFSRHFIPGVKHRYMSGNEWFPYVEHRAWHHVQRFVLPMIKLEKMKEAIDLAFTPSIPPSSAIPPSPSDVTK